MPIKTLIPETPGTFVLQPGSPGAPGGPGGPAAPNAGAGWELGVYDAAQGFGILLAKIPQRLWTSFTFSKLLNDKGTGTVVLNMDDPWWNNTVVGGLAGHYLLDEEHTWRVFQDGVARFDFLGETITEQLIDASESRLVTITGPGTIAALDWAIAAPPGFPNTIVYKTDALADSFSEIDVNGNYVVDYALWNASSPTAEISINPAGSIRLIGSSGGTVLGTTEWDLTNTLLSAQVSPIVSPDLAGNTLNGSQLTQMFAEDISGTGYYALMGMSSGDLYAQYKGPDGTFTQVIATAAAYATGMSNSSQYSYWQISERSGTFFFWVSADGQTWKQVWQKNRQWDSSKVGVYFAAQYSGSGEYATVTSINSDVTSSSLGGATYLSTPIMSVYLQTLNAAKSRGTIPFVTTQFTQGTDSFGTPWADSQSVQIQNGTGLYSLLQGHASMVDADYIMEPGFRLVVGLPAASTPNPGQVTLGYDRSKQVVFYEAGGTTMKQRQRQRNAIANLIAVINSDSLTVTAANAGSVATWGQREAWIQAAAQVTANDLNIVASAASQQSSSEILSWTLQITPNMPGRTVYKDFAVGDWVGLERPDFSAVDAVRVIGITVAVDQNGVETHELVLQSYVQWLEQRLTYIATKMGGGFVSANGTTAISDNAQGSTLQAPTVFSPTLASLGVPASKGGAPLVYNPVTGQWVPAGSTDPVTGSEVPLTVATEVGQTTVSSQGISVGSPTMLTALNANSTFLGGSLTGWQAVSASIASQAPSAGLPSQQYVAKLTPSGSSLALIQTSTPLIPVQAGQDYTLFANAYLPAQSNMGITTQIAWYDAKGNLLRTDSTSTIIPASQWVTMAYQDQAPGPAYDTQVLSSSPAAWWKLSDASGATAAADSSGYSHPGTPTSVTFATAFAPVPGNTCGSFNGTTSKVATAFSPTGYAQLTIEAWVNLNGNTEGASPTIVGSSNTPSDNGGFVLGIAGSTATFSIGSGTAHTAVASATGTLPSTGWTHLAATWDGTNVILYINGAVAATSTFAGPLAAGQSTVAIGWNPVASGGQFFKGYIGEVAVYPSALPPAIIALHAINLTVPGAGTGAAQAAVGVGITSGSSSNPGQFGNVQLVQGLQAGANSNGASSTSVTQTGTVVTDSSGTPRIVAGVQPDGTVTTNYYNSPPPNAPDTPLVSATMLGINVVWDGQLGGTGFGSGSPPLSDFAYVAVHMSTTNGFQPTSATLQGTLTTPGNISVTQLTAGTTYYVVLVAYNDAGIASAASLQASATAQSVSQNIPAGAISASQVSFRAGGILVTIGATAPSSPATGDLWYDSNNGYELKQWSGSAWTPYQFGTNAISAGAITAALIAANTITAAQIASGTITATQIAANTITAAQIASATITSAQIAANTITASNIAANTITAAKLVAGITVSGIVDATTINSATITGSTFKGTNWQADANGTRWYSATPAANNLVASEAAAAYTDSFGNSVLAGSCVYSTGSGTCTYVQVNNGSVTSGTSSGSGQSGWSPNLSGLAGEQSGVLSYTNQVDGQTYRAGKTFTRMAGNQPITSTSAVTIGGGSFGPIMQFSVVTGYVYYFNILLIVSPDQTGGGCTFQFGLGGTSGAVVGNANGFAFWSPTGNQSPGFQIWDGSMSATVASHAFTSGQDQVMKAEVWGNFTTGGLISLQVFETTSGDSFHVKSCMFTQEVGTVYP